MIQVKEEKNCKSCKKDKLSIKEKFLVVLGLYMFAASIYGTIQLIKNFL